MLAIPLHIFGVVYDKGQFVWARTAPCRLGLFIAPGSPHGQKLGRRRLDSDVRLTALVLLLRFRAWTNFFVHIIR